MASSKYYGKISQYCAANNVEAYVIDDGCLIVCLDWSWAIVPPDDKPIRYSTKPMRVILKNASCKGRSMTRSEFENLLK